MKFKIILLAGMFVFCLTTVRAQVAVEYYWGKVKHTLEPLAPLAPEKTFNVKLPDSLNFLLGRNEVRKYWAGYGLQLINKWNEKTPADYTFRFELDGLNILQTQEEERKSARTVTGKEFFRHYQFSFPARLVVIDNATKETLRTITVTTGEDTFVRTLHRNFFITDGFDPNYKKEIGFDSLRTLKRIQNTDGRVLRQLEGEFALEIFEKMKASLVSLYGKETLKAYFAAFNPKAKNRMADFSDFDTHSQKMIKAYELLAVNWKDEDARKLLQEAEDFYVARAETPENRFHDYVPLIIHYNLAHINLIQNDFEKADLYYTKALTGEIPDAYFDMFCKPNYMEARKALEIRHMASQNKGYAVPQRAAFKTPVVDTPVPVVTKGYVVTSQRDTLKGSFKDFAKASYTESIAFTDQQGNEKKINWKDVKFASTEGLVYESMIGSLVVIIYHSPTIQVYRVRQNGEYLYNFPKMGTFGKYTPFSRDDAANYVVNYNKQLSEVFKSCAAVVSKIESGTYELKSEKAKGHITVIGDFENACGAGGFEQTFKKFQYDTVVKSYK